MADRYPGDDEFTRLLLALFAQVKGGSITFRRLSNDVEVTETTSVTDLCRKLVKRHNEGKNPSQTKTNAEFVGLRLDEATCSKALTSPRGYPSMAGWLAWAGYYDGPWYDSRQQFNDPARWDRPRLEKANSPTDPNREYHHQPVEWPRRPANDGRYGWNQSHPAVPYVWGWDPKQGAADRGGLVGLHLGFPFEVGAVSCIVWLTYEEAFLECIGPSGGGKARTSTGLWGYGQWTVS